MNKVVAATFIVALGLLILSGGSASAQSGAAPAETSQSSELQLEKLREEIRQLRIQNDRLSAPWRDTFDAVPLITGLVAVAGVIAAYWKQVTEGHKQREEDRRQREQDREQREREGLRRFDANFTAVLTGLGSESPAAQASAVASLMTYLKPEKPEYENFLEDIFYLIVANLKIDRTEVVRGMLVHAFERALVPWLSHNQTRTKVSTLDLTRANLRRMNLESIDFNGIIIDLAFSQCDHANLTKSIIPRMRGFGVDLCDARLSRAKMQEARLNNSKCKAALFHETQLVSATFKNATLCGAEFYKASLQGAHFDGADITDASFEEANLNDTYFPGVTVNDKALKSISRSENWRKAHFDQHVAERIQSLSHDTSAAPPEPGTGAADPAKRDEALETTPLA